MVLTEPLILSILVVIKKLFFFNFFVQLLEEEIVGNNELLENVVYIGSKSIKNNGASDWLEKKSTICCVLNCPADKKASMCCIDKFFLAKN